MSTPKGTEDEEIGRPGPWRETRYQPPDKSLDREVADPSQKPEAQSPKTPSRPVTREDYTGKA